MPEMTLPNQVSRRASAWTLTLFAVLLVFDTFAARYFELEPFRHVADFLLVLASLGILGIGFAKRTLSWLAILLLIALAAFTALSELGAFSDGWFSAIWSSILFCKIFILFFASKNLKLSQLRSAIYTLAMMHVAGMALNLTIPSFFEGLMTEVPFERDISRVMGFLLNDNKSAALSTILALYFWFIKDFKIIGLVFICATFLAASVSMLIIFIVAAAYLQYLRSPKSAALAFTPILAITGAVLYYYLDIWSKIALISPDESSLYIRAVMLFRGIELAKEFFPFGTGGGTFGSSLSSGSDVYSYLGIDNLRSVREMTGVFDCSIGSILGEYGVLGFVITIILLFFLFKLRGTGLITYLDSIVLCGLTIFLSFFRSVIPDFYYSAFVLFLLLIIAEIRARARGGH